MKAKLFDPNCAEHKSKLKIFEVNNVKAFIFFRGRGRLLIYIMELFGGLIFVVALTILLEVTLMNGSSRKFFFCDTAYGFLNRVPSGN